MAALQQTRNVYDLFASVYARHFGPETLRIVLPIHERLLLSSLHAGAEILDVCCGAGHLATALLRQGFRVTGIDSSAVMLSEAQANAPEARFLLADAQYFSTTTKFDAALSTFNSLAHMPDVYALARVFRNIRDSLLPTAEFCFDLFMQEAYERRWRGEFRVVAEGETCIVRPSYDAPSRTARNDITLFDESTGRIISSFTLFQKAHSEDQLRSALDRAGFADVRAFDAARDFGMNNEAGRAFFLCRR